MKKLVVSLNIGNYAPKIRKICTPYARYWAKKIGADFKWITKPKFNRTPNYEKFQIYEMSKKYDWTFFIDADLLIPIDWIDPTEFLEKDCVLFNDTDFANHRFRYDHCFRRSHSNYGATTWFCAFSDWTRDAWRPMELQDDMTWKKAIENIRPIQIEKNFGIDREHIVDDYLVSRNIAKYGLKVKTLKRDIYPALGLSPSLNHLFLDSIENKQRFLKNVVDVWKKLDGGFYAEEHKGAVPTRNDFPLKEHLKKQNDKK